MTANQWAIIANTLSCLRLILAIALPFLPARWMFPVLLVGGLTDWLDGWISRRFQAESAFGMLIDPIADKALVGIAILVAILKHWLSWPEALALAARDIVVSAIALAALLISPANRQKLTPRWSGKIATTLQLAALLTLFWFQHPLPLFVGLAAIVSIVAALDYTVTGFKKWRAR